MKKITLSADEELIRRAQAKARSDKTTLTAEFRLWLTAYAESPPAKESAQQQKAVNAQGSLFSRSVTALRKFEKKLEKKL